jgi:hypothetical protein
MPAKPALKIKGVADIRRNERIPLCNPALKLHAIEALD